MSAFLAVRKATGVDILADVGVWDAAGVLIGMASKIFPIGNAVLVARGNIILSSAFSRVAAAIFSSFDDLVNGYEDLARAARRELGDAFDLHQHLVCGFSEAAGRFEMRIDNGDGCLADAGPMVITGPERTIARFAAPFLDADGEWRADTIEQIDIVRDGLPAFMAMREEPCHLTAADPSSPIVVGVGGGVERVRVGRRRVDLWQPVHRWPDRIGEPIPLPSPLAA